MLSPILTLAFHSEKAATPELLAKLEAKSKALAGLMAEYSGCSFGQGLYRVHPASELDDWTLHCTKMFPEYASRAVCFASDWHGRQFAIDTDRRSSETDDCLCLMFDPNTALAYEIDSTLDDLHCRELAARSDELLLSKMHADWLQSDPAPAIDECVAYEHPIFLGGPEEFANLECCNMEYYWELTAELRSQSRNFPPGAKVTRVVTRE